MSKVEVLNATMLLLNGSRSRISEPGIAHIRICGSSSVIFKERLWKSSAIIERRSWIPRAIFRGRSRTSRAFLQGRLRLLLRCSIQPTKSLHIEVQTAAGEWSSRDVIASCCSCCRLARPEAALNQARRHVTQRRLPVATVLHVDQDGDHLIQRQHLLALESNNNSVSEWYVQ